MELPNNLRSAIITAHGLCGWGFQRIQDDSNGLIPRTTASDIWHHTVNSAQIALGTSSDISWYTLLEYIEPSKRSGRPKVVKGPLKTNLRQAILDNATAPFIEVAYEQGLDISATTTRAIAKSLSPSHPYRIVRRKRPHKLVLWP